MLFLFLIMKCSLFLQFPKTAMVKNTNVSLNEYLVDSFLGLSCFSSQYFTVYMFFTLNLYLNVSLYLSTFLYSFSRWSYSSYCFACDLNTHNLNSDISAQTSLLGSILVYPNLLGLSFCMSQIHLYKHVRSGTVDSSWPRQPGLTFF